MHPQKSKPRRRGGSAGGNPVLIPAGKNDIGEKDMAAENTFHFPKPGQRIVRSVIAVACCFCVFYLRNREGIPFYSALAVLQCIQPYQDSMAQVAKKRVTGTFVGAFWGLVIILIQMYLFHGSLMDTFPGYMLISLFTGIVIYSTVVLNCKNTAYFSCVVFLSITVMHMTDESPFLFVFNRVLDTLIGVEIALIVNTVHLPRKRQKDILFVSGIDDTLLNQKYQMSTSQAQTICDFLDRKGISYFTNCVVDDLLVIYYDQLISPLHQEVYERRHRSPHRNYVQKTQSVYENVVYLYLLDKKEIMEKLYRELMEQEWIDSYRVAFHDPIRYPGCANIKIYIKDATRENMLRNLKALLNLDKVITFGSVEGRYDVCIEDTGKDEMVKTLKKLYEPVGLEKETVR
ncbi:hypothetical protein GPK81_09500 [Blautia sp. MCC283]|nr:hypothetical protein [Blautia sp. MCC283]